MLAYLSTIHLEQRPVILTPLPPQAEAYYAYLPIHY